MPARLVHGEALTRYDFGPDHPMCPGRVALAISLADSLGVLDRLEVVEPEPAEDDLLALVHTPDYIAAVRSERAHRVYGLGTTDNPITPGMHQAASQICTATVQAARAIASGDVLAAANVAGGLHHAMPSATSGFCVYNDAAIGIRWLRDHGVGRVAYLDLDAHHGDGVQEIFYDDPDVLTISLHESPAHLFPGTGYPTEIGGPGARGSAVNVALPPHTADADWLRAFDAVVPPVLRAFAPDVLVTQHGCDAHVTDPLTDLRLTMDGMAASYRRVAELAAEVTGGRWLALGGGGYSPVHGVARAWTHLLAVLSGEPIDPTTAVPSAWRERFGADAPSTMGDGVDAAFTPFSAGMDPESAVDQAIAATRRAVFPELGLDPDPY